MNVCIHTLAKLLANQGRIQDFSKGGLRAMVMYKLHYIHIAIIHIIILTEWLFVRARTNRILAIYSYGK